MKWKSFIKGAGELCFPSHLYCIGCGAFIDKSRPYALCDDCRETFHWAVGRTCSRCGRPLPEEWNIAGLHETTEEKECWDCRETSHSFDKGFACVQYGLKERSLILGFKYGDKAYFGEKLSEAMYDRLELCLEDMNLVLDLVISVPMHADKERKRGYNQADLLARPLAAHLGIPYDKNILERYRKTAPMSRLSPWERAANIKSAIRLAPGKEALVKGKRILLVDDIYTTGSTGDACTDILKAAGAEAVYLYCFAAGSSRPANVRVLD